MAIFKKINNKNAGADSEKGELIHCWWGSKLVQLLGRFQKFQTRTTI
jgi:hypothetical protein